MPRSYTVTQGDTFDSVARKVYGDDKKAFLVRKANPGAAQPLIVGSSLAIPNDPDAPSAQRVGVASDPDETAISVDGSRFRFWTQVEITRSIDAVDTAAFVAPFEPSRQEFRDTFRPFSYKDADIDIGGVRLFTGTLVAPAPSSGPNTSIVTAGCYSLPGALADCTAPASAYPLSWDNVTLRTVAADLAALFGLGVEFTSDAGPVFERVSLTPGSKVMSFLSDLASQRDLVIGSTPSGKLLFQKAVKTGRAVANFTEGQSPLISATPSFSPQDYYSHVTGITPVLIGLPGTQYTVKNGRLSGVVRPYTYDSPDVLDGELVASVQSKAGRMFASAVEYNLELTTWRDENGDLWAPNTLVTLEAPRGMVYRRSTFLVRSVILRRNDKQKTATLVLTLPGALAGEIPERMPWDD